MASKSWRTLPNYKKARVFEGSVHFLCIFTVFISAGPWRTSLRLRVKDPTKHKENPRPTPLPGKSWKLSFKTSQSLQNGLQNDAWNHQIMEIVENVKSNGNHTIKHVFERLGHWKTVDFLFKIHQGTWLQCRSAFCDSKTQNISKSDSKLTPVGHPESIKNL